MTDEWAGQPSDRQLTEDEDWIKTLAWDLPTQLDELILGLVGPGATLAEQQQALRDLMALPAWKAAPASIVSEARDFLEQS